MITSTQNSKIKWVRLLQSESAARRDAGVFIIEGLRMAQEVIARDLRPKLVLFTEDFAGRAATILEELTATGAALEMVSSQVMKSASDTQTPQGILAVIPIPSKPVPQTLELVLVPDSLRDPGNLGAMLRSSAAAGVDAVFLPPETVDVYAPKVVRSGMGAHFYVPIFPLNWEEINSHLAGLQILIADAKRGKPYYEIDMTPPLALIVGGEAAGASQQAGSLASEYVNIPMPGDIESLNAAVAAGILLFEAARQKQSNP